MMGLRLCDFKADMMLTITLLFRDGHALLSLRLSRNAERLDAEKTFELCHHILKAHIYRQIPPDQMCISAREAQAHWVAMAAADIHSALGYERNIHFPNTKVQKLKPLVITCS